MAGQWDAIVEGDYDAVMPLPFRKKFGVRYIFQPAFIQQGGIFSKYEITEAGTGLFLDLAFQHFRFAEFTLNYSNSVEENYKPKFRSNFIIPLDEDLNIGIITQDQKFYKELEIAEKFSLLYNHANDPNQAIGLYQKLYGSRLPFFERNDFKKFSSVCEALDPADIINREARSNDDLHAQCLLIRYKQRLYNLVNNVTAAGRASSTNYFLFNEIVEIYYLRLPL